MKEELFNYNDSTYDVGFSNSPKVSLYVLRDKLSGVVISEIIKAKNDLVAMKGFKEFIDKKQDKDRDFSVYSLQFIGILDEEKAVIEAAESNQEICDSRDNLQDIIDKATAFVLAQLED